MARKVRLIGPESSPAPTPEQATQILVPFDKSPVSRVRFSHSPDPSNHPLARDPRRAAATRRPGAGPGSVALQRGHRRGVLRPDAGRGLGGPDRRAAHGPPDQGRDRGGGGRRGSALRLAMVRVPVERPERLVDTCGTGGGRVGTLNISTAAAFVVAGAGVPVAKHGNRSFTSRSGSADVLEALGVNIQLDADQAAGVLRQAGLVFLFAPSFHPAMRHVGPVRKELGVPTIMNLLGPLANPAGVSRQVIGVAEPHRAPLVAAALARLGRDPRAGASRRSGHGRSESHRADPRLGGVRRERGGVGDRPAGATAWTAPTWTDSRAASRPRTRSGSSSCWREARGPRRSAARCCSMPPRASMFPDEDGRSRNRSSGPGPPSRAGAGMRRAGAPQAGGGRERHCHPETNGGLQYFRITPTTTPWIRTSRS